MKSKLHYSVPSQKPDHQYFVNQVEAQTDNQ
jgi:hypothetical protein